MGRKLPGKRHRQVKDPYEINKRKDAGKNINKKPGDPDSQELPRALRDIMRFTNSLKSDKKIKPVKNETKKHWRDSDDEYEDTGKPEKRLSTNKKLVNSNKQVMQNQKLVEKYKASVDYDLTGKSKKSKRKRNEMDGSESEEEEEKEDDAKKKKLKKKRSKMKMDALQEQKLKKENNKKLRLQKLKRKKNRRLKKLKALESELGENMTDQVNFGEIVHNPPTLTVRPKGTDVRKAGRRTLLLKDMMLAGKIRLKNS